MPFAQLVKLLNILWICILLISTLAESQFTFQTGKERNDTWVIILPNSMNNTDFHSKTYTQSDSKLHTLGLLLSATRDFQHKIAWRSRGWEAGWGMSSTGARSSSVEELLSRDSSLCTERKPLLGEQICRIFYLTVVVSSVLCCTRNAILKNHTLLGVQVNWL